MGVAQEHKFQEKYSGDSNVHSQLEESGATRKDFKEVLMMQTAGRTHRQVGLNACSLVTLAFAPTAPMTALGMLLPHSPVFLHHLGNASEYGVAIGKDTGAHEIFVEELTESSAP